MSYGEAFAERPTGVKLVQAIGAVLIGVVIGAAVLIAEPRIGVMLRDVAARAFSKHEPPTLAKLPDYAGAVLVTDLREGGVSHFLGPTISIRTTKSVEFHSGITLRLIVDQSGTVVSAEAKAGLKEFFAEAERLAKTIKFIPFRRGRPLVASRIRRRTWRWEYCRGHTWRSGWRAPFRTPCRTSHRRNCRHCTSNNA